MKRIFGVLAAVLFAAAGTTVLLLYVKGAHARAEAGEPRKNVLVVTVPIPKGAPAEQVGQSVVVRAVPLSMAAPSALEALAAVNGKVTSTALLPGDQVVPERFISPEQANRGDVPPGLLEVTLSLPVDRALGGEVAKGDTVGMVVTLEAEGELPTETHFLLHKVLVTRVQMVGASASTSNATKTTATSAPGQQSSEHVAAQENQPRGPEGAPKGSLLLTFALDASSVERVVFAAENASLWLAAEPKDAPETGTRSVNRRNVL